MIQYYQSLEKAGIVEDRHPARARAVATEALPTLNHGAGVQKEPGRRDAAASLLLPFDFSLWHLLLAKSNWSQRA